MGTLLLADRDPDSHHPFAKQWFDRELDYVFGLSEANFCDFLEQARTQRVLRRTLEVLTDHLDRCKYDYIPERVGSALCQERGRAETAVAFLHTIVSGFEQQGHPIMVMKTLDHWPDTGSDLDLLVVAPEQTVCRIFETEFDARRQTQSWGDRLANKWNFQIRGLSELVEVHVGCLGQTGEQKTLASRLLSRKVYEVFGQCPFPVPLPEDRIVIAALQRMYRHFYIRLTDIVNILGLITHDRIDFDQLKTIAEVGAIWPGVATLLVIIRQHGLRYGSRSVELPECVKAAAQFNAKQTYLGRRFVRVPIVPEGANLFLRQLVGNGRKRDFQAMMRLTLLPILATAAFVSFRITGDDKGVW
jgi:Uncharacterised nucleotidyltransferase